MNAALACRRAVVVLAAAGLLGCGGSTTLGTAPTSFGVNLTIRIDSNVRAQVQSVTLAVSGGETFSRTVPIGSFSGNEARLHYVPGITAGMLTFSGQGLTSTGATIAMGTSGSVTLAAGKSVSALLVIAGSTTDGGTDGMGTAGAMGTAGMGGGGADGAAGGGTDGGGDAQGPAKKGESCAGGNACDTGLLCVDGVCCDAKCDGACTACNLKGREGTCSPVPAGMMPATGHTACTPDDMTTCKQDGMCDGAGACRLWPVGTTCRASTCDQTTDAFTPEFKCDGKGVCQTNIAIACAPFKCKDASVCVSTCADSTQCQANHSCLNGSCGLKPRGATCTGGAECADGNCADGACCDKPCQAGCESCNLPNTRGTCTNVPPGADPKGVCPAGTAENAVCSPGGCSGAGGTACVKAATTVVCRQPACGGGIAVNAATCQANGVCPALSQTVCGVYTCGSGVCNVRCAGDGDCVAGYYCAANSTCQADKGSGQGCGAQHECQNGLTCIDGVCCNTPSCPQCRNCGADGMCSVVVGSAAGLADNSGATCNGALACNGSGSCLAVLGQACGTSPGACVSGNCVDGVCCGVASCGQCLNCGTTGACTIAVKSADDVTGATCANDTSCDANATCKQRWMLVGKVAMTTAPDYYYTTGAGNFIYFSSGVDESTFNGVFKSFNVTNSTFADEGRMTSPMCNCGYLGTLVGGADARIYNAANTAASYISGAAAWLPMGTYTSRGEAATAVVGSHIYYMGGRGGLTTGQMFNTATGTWTTTGIAALPNGISTEDSCAGAAGGVMYMFGGNNMLGMLSYTESSNSWAMLPATANPPHGVNCYYRNLPTWRSKLVYIDGQLEVFNPSLQQWEPSVALPVLAGASWTAAVAGAAGNLYVVGFSAGATYIYQWVFN